jgi:hypothetical protein
MYMRPVVANQGKASSIYKRQIRPLVREGPQQNQDHNCQTLMNKYLIMISRWGSTPRLTDWLTVSRNVTLTLTNQQLGKNVTVVRNTRNDSSIVGLVCLSF